MQKDCVILQVDDDADDLAMLQTAFQSLGTTCKLLQEKDGRSCLTILQNWPNNKPLPCLVVLDLNMPGMDGKQTFTSIRSNPKLAAIPIIIFSTSSGKADKSFFTGEHVEYIVKPYTFERLKEVAAHMLSVCAVHD